MSEKLWSHSHGYEIKFQLNGPFMVSKFCKNSELTSSTIWFQLQIQVRVLQVISLFGLFSIHFKSVAALIKLAKQLPIALGLFNHSSEI